jgi:uroporphyrinogen-III synthase
MVEAVENSAHASPSLLQGYRILVTRPEPENQLLCAALTTLGATTHALPLQTRLSEVNAPPPDLDAHQGVIVVSPTAAQLAAPAIQAAHLNWQPIWSAIGKSTATQLENLLGVHVITPDPENSEALLKLAFLQTAQVQNQQWLLIKGQGGRTTIQDVLIQRGAQVSIWNLYQREPSVIYQQAMHDIQCCGFKSDAIMVTNAEALQLLVKLIDQHQTQAVLQLPIVVPGSRLTALARALGFQQVISSDGAQNDCLIAALQNFLLSAAPKICDHPS